LNNIVLYTTGCPKCKVLERKLAEKNIQYTEGTDIEKMLELGIYNMPVLGVDDKLLNFGEAINWVRDRGEE